MKQRENSAAGMVVGMATGAVLGAAGAMMATQNAVLQLDRMVGDFVEKHIDC